MSQTKNERKAAQREAYLNGRAMSDGPSVDQLARRANKGRARKIAPSEPSVIALTHSASPHGQALATELARVAEVMGRIPEMPRTWGHTEIGHGPEGTRRISLEMGTSTPFDGRFVEGLGRVGTVPGQQGSGECVDDLSDPERSERIRLGKPVRVIWEYPVGSTGQTREIEMQQARLSGRKAKPTVSARERDQVARCELKRDDAQRDLDDSVALISTSMRDAGIAAESARLALESGDTLTASVQAEKQGDETRLARAGNQLAREALHTLRRIAQEIPVGSPARKRGRGQVPTARVVVRTVDVSLDASGEVSIVPVDVRRDTVESLRQVSRRDMDGHAIIASRIARNRDGTIARIEASPEIELVASRALPGAATIADVGQSSAYLDRFERTLLAITEARANRARACMCGLSSCPHCKV